MRPRYETRWHAPKLLYGSILVLYGLRLRFLPYEVLVR